MVKKSNKSISSLEAKIRRLENETRITPKVGPARRDPPPISSQKTHYVTRRVRCFVESDTNSVNLTVDGVKAQAGVQAFKITHLTAYVSGGAQVANFILGSDTWAGGSSANGITYTDIAPLDSLCACKFDIPDHLALQLNTGSVVVMNASLGGSATNIKLTVDVTLSHQY
jgi:hypothetical protein